MKNEKAIQKNQTVKYYYVVKVYADIENDEYPVRAEKQFTTCVYAENIREALREAQKDI